MAYIDKKEHIVTGDRQVPVIGTHYRGMLISNDGLTLAYEGVSSVGRHYVVVDDKKLGDFDFIWNLSMINDDKQISFGAKIGNELSWNVITLRE